MNGSLQPPLDADRFSNREWVVDDHAAYAVVSRNYVLEVSLLHWKLLEILWNLEGQLLGVTVIHDHLIGRTCARSVELFAPVDCLDVGIVRQNPLRDREVALSRTR